MTTDPTTPTRRRPLLRAAVAAVVGAGLIAALAPAASAQPADRSTAVVASTADHAALDAALAGLTAKRYTTSALGAVREHGRLAWRNATGVADLDSNAPADPGGRFRIGSVTKTFVATVLLQLVGEGRLSLDDTVESLLPGEVPNGANITVRQLMNHTSGLPNYTRDRAFDVHDQGWLATGRYRSYSLQDLLDIAWKYPPAFPPGTDWQYSNTNYLVVGMIIEDLTGNSWNDEVERRVIRPLGLTGTSMPDDSPFIHGPHAHGYFKMPDGPVDVTDLDPSMAGSAGAGISTTADLTKFIGALLDGRLLPPAELAAMQQTTTHGGGRSYGLALLRMDTPCGTFWGHDGGIPGYNTLMLGSADGKRQFASSVTPYDLTDGPGATAALNTLIATGTCGG
ncbi:serine hydrolase domain-containing protein [Kitasatospora sp. NPDC001660]